MVVGEALTWTRLLLMLQDSSINCGKWWISNVYVVASLGALVGIEEDMGI
jgi:hypothetical protein